MINIVKAEEIARLKHQLDEDKQRRRELVSEMEKMEDALRILQKKTREIEEGLQETYDTISRRLSVLPYHCKIRVTYLEKVKSKFMNSQSEDALESIRESQRKAKSKLLRFEDDLEELDRKIRSTEDQILQLSQKVD